MALNVALHSAVSSLLVIEKQMGVASNNISNANTVGYTEQTVDVSTQATQGNVTGVKAGVATTHVDEFLSASIVKNTSSSSEASTYYSYCKTLSDAMGSISTTSTGGNDLASELSDLQTTLSSLANTPNDTALKTKAISELTTLTANLRDTSSTIQKQRANADQDISSAVSDANTQLTAIRDLNIKIREAGNRGDSTATLLNQRSTALESLSKDIGVNYYNDSAGNVQIYSTGGTPLLIGDQAATISHSAVSSAGTSVTYTSGASTGIDGIWVNGEDVTSSLTGGKIGALVQVRDQDLTNAQTELDEMSSTLSSTLNTIHNQGTSLNPPQTLTGTSETAFSSGEAVTVASGTTFRIAVMNSSAQATGYCDVDLSGCSTVGDVVDAINTAIAGASPSMDVTCSLTNGQMVLSAGTAGEGVGVTTLSGSIAASSSATGTDVSSYFHLNDLLTGGSSAATVKVRSDISTAPGLMAAGKLVSTSSPGTPPFTAVTQGDGTVGASLSSALLSNQSFDASGVLADANVSFSGYAALIVASVSQNTSDADANATTQSSTLSTLQASFSSESGVNTDEQTAKLAELQNMYAASAKIVSVVSSMFQSLISAVQA